MVIVLLNSFPLESRLKIDYFNTLHAGMEYHFYHIKLAPLSVTFLLRKCVYCVIGATPMDYVVITRYCVSGVYEISIICSYKSKTHFVQIWADSQFRQQSYEPLLDGVSACLDHVANYFATFLERVVQRGVDKSYI